jgi:cell division protein FtsX
MEDRYRRRPFAGARTGMICAALAWVLVILAWHMLAGIWQYLNRF